MSGIGFWELVILFVIGLLILGPERLPRVATQIGRWVGKARRTANQLRYQIEREVTLADIEEKKKQKNKDEAHASDRKGSSGSDTAAPGPGADSVQSPSGDTQASAPEPGEEAAEAPQQDQVQNQDKLV